MRFAPQCDSLPAVPFGFSLSHPLPRPSPALTKAQKVFETLLLLLLIIINVLILVAGIVARRRVMVVPVDIVACQRVLKKVLPLGPACWHSTAAPTLLGFPQSPIFLLKNIPSISKPSSPNLSLHRLCPGSEIVPKFPPSPGTGRPTHVVLQQVGVVPLYPVVEDGDHHVPARVAPLPGGEDVHLRPAAAASVPAVLRAGAQSLISTAHPAQSTFNPPQRVLPSRSFHLTHRFVTASLP